MTNSNIPACYVFWRSARGLEQSNTSARTLFEAAKKALEHFAEGYGPKPKRDTILQIEIKPWPKPDQVYRVRAGRVVEHYKLDPRRYLSS